MEGYEVDFIDWLINEGYGEEDAATLESQVNDYLVDRGLKISTAPSSLVTEREERRVRTKKIQ